MSGPWLRAWVAMTTTAGTRLNSPSGPAKRVQPPRPAPPDDHLPRRHPIALVGAGVALWTVLLGLALIVCVVLIAWISAAHHSNALAPALATAVAAWLLAQHCALSVPGGEVSIVPLGLSWFLGALLVRGGRQAARLAGVADVRGVVAVTAAVAVPYGVAAGLLTRGVRDVGVQATAVHAVPGALMLALLCVGYGALRETNTLRPILDLLPSRATLLLKAAGAATAIVVGIAAAGTALVLVGHLDRAKQLSDSLHPGLPGTALLALVSLVYLPNAVVWTASFGTGPGFAVGTGTSVSLSGVHLGAVPALPLLAPLPQTGHAPLLGWLFFAGVLAAGLVTGWLVAKRADIDAGTEWWQRYRLPDAGLALGAGAVGGVAIGVVSWLSAGAVGPGRMSVVGPSGARIGGAAAVEIGLAAAASVVAIAWRAQRSAALVVTEPVFEPVQLEFDTPVDEPASSAERPELDPPTT